MDTTYLRHLATVVGRDANLLRKRRSNKTVDFQGITIRIDRPAGYVQRGRDENGKDWERTYKTDYGYIPGTLGGDGEGLDVYLGPDRHAKLAYWIHQRKASGEFDEYKLMLGFIDRRSARAMWAAHTPERLYGGIASTSIGMVKALLGLEPVAIGKAIDAMVELDAETITASRLQKSEGLSARLLKTEDNEQRYVLGIVLEPDVVDSQGDTYDAETIRRACWTYMTEFQNRGLQHEQLVNQAVKLVECWIAPVPIEINGVAIKAGTWLAGFHIVDDELWKAVKDGELGGLSIGGVAQKVDPTTGQLIKPPPEESRFNPS